MQSNETNKLDKPDKQQGGAAAVGGGAPASVSTAISSGRPLDDAGGAGLGRPAGEGDRPAVTQPPEKRAPDPQDRRGDA
ncbi:MAG TPA: hypothetical protein VIM12_13885 [Noviherbaspirillum sp.]|uniref:hypothetical protein n=1 Tax=Noviherbaspirillum sp. TaxID=1926288 RepID=UPI002F94F775